MTIFWNVNFKRSRDFNVYMIFKHYEDKTVVQKIVYFYLAVYNSRHMILKNQTWSFSFLAS